MSEITMAERLAALPELFEPIKDIVTIVDTTVQGLDNLDGVEDFGTRIAAAEAGIGTLEGTLEAKTLATYVGAGKKEVTVSGALAATDTVVLLNTADGAMAVTLAAPTVNQLLIITQIDGGTDGHTVTLDAGTFDGTNEIATFNAAGETLILFGVSATRFAILANTGSVVLSHAAG